MCELVHFLIYRYQQYWRVILHLWTFLSRSLSFCHADNELYCRLVICIFNSVIDEEDAVHIFWLPTAWQCYCLLFVSLLFILLIPGILLFCFSKNFMETNALKSLPAEMNSISHSSCWCTSLIVLISEGFPWIFRFLGIS